MEVTHVRRDWESRRLSQLLVAALCGANVGSSDWRFFAAALTTALAPFGSYGTSAILNLGYYRPLVDRVLAPSGS